MHILQLVSLICTISLVRYNNFSSFRIFHFQTMSTLTTKSTKWYDFFFLLIITMSGLLVELGRSVCISKSLIILWVSLPKRGSRLRQYNFAVSYNFNLLYSSRWIPFLIQSSLFLNYFCASLIFWLPILFLFLYHILAIL